MLFLNAQWLKHQKNSILYKNDENQVFLIDNLYSGYIDYLGKAPMSQNWN
jgi:hypothetical protein